MESGVTLSIFFNYKNDQEEITTDFTKMIHAKTPKSDKRFRTYQGPESPVRENAGLMHKDLIFRWSVVRGRSNKTKSLSIRKPFDCSRDFRHFRVDLFG